MLNKTSDWKPGTRIFTDGEEAEIYRRRKAGEHPVSLAFAYKVTTQTIHNVIKRVERRQGGAA